MQEKVENIYIFQDYDFIRELMRYFNVSFLSIYDKFYCHYCYYFIIYNMFLITSNHIRVYVCIDLHGQISPRSMKDNDFDGMSYKLKYMDT